MDFFTPFTFNQSLFIFMPTSSLSDVNTSLIPLQRNNVVSKENLWTNLLSSETVFLTDLQTLLKFFK
jgi:hypothetical protein